MNLNLNYYFENYEDIEIFKMISENVNYVFEIQKNAKEFLAKEVTDKNLKINNGELLGEATFLGNYFIGEGTKIYGNVVIEGPCYIGKNVEIKPGAYIRPGTIIGDKCVVGFNSEIKNTIMQNGAKVASLAFVGDSILGKSARIGSGVIIANRRFDQKNVRVKNEEGEKIDTGTDFFGSIIGDYSRIGANSVTFPGTFIGQYSWVYPLTQVRGFVPSLKKVHNGQNLIFEENEKNILK